VPFCLKIGSRQPAAPWLLNQKWSKTLQGLIGAPLLRSLKAVNKGATPFSGGARRSAPDPGLGPGVQPPGGVGHCMVNFFGIDKGLLEN
jgi:hypothetical protein